MRDQLEHLYRGLSFSRSEAKLLMDNILDRVYPEAQVAAFLSALQMRLPTPAELSGFRESLLRRASLLDLERPDAIDMVGTGGDGFNTFNITTISALTVAAAGFPVIKHGNGSASSKHGSSDTLRACGFSFRQDRDACRRQLEVANITFLHAPLFHPELAAVAGVRRAMAVRTLFNLLGPLVNPARPAYNFIGVADARVQGLYAQVFAPHSAAYSIVHSNDGYDEATLTGPVRCATSRGRFTLRPSDFDLAPTCPRSIEVDSDNRAQFIRILKGEGSREQHDTVAANAGLAIQLRTADDLKTCVQRAAETLRSGEVFRNFEKLLAA